MGTFHVPCLVPRGRSSGADGANRAWPEHPTSIACGFEGRGRRLTRLSALLADRPAGERGGAWRRKMRRVSRKSVGCSRVAFRPGAGGGPDTGMAGEARARPLTPPMPHGEAPGRPLSRMPKEPESRRNPGESVRAAPSPGAPRGPARRRTRSCDASWRGPRVPTLIENRRNPRAAAILAFASRRSRKRTLSCGNVSWKWGAGSSTFSGCGLTSAEAQPLSAPAVSPWTR